jgi:hypothetical protein
LAAPEECAALPVALFVAGLPVRDLLLCAKHLFVAAILAGRERAAPFLKEQDTTTRRKSPLHSFE